MKELNSENGMILEIRISHFAIIDELHLTLGPGLNIFSGETGAGKSLMLRALGLLMGHKLTAGTISKGAVEATVEGVFDLTQREDIKQKLQSLGIESDDGQLIVRRFITSEGKSRVYMNGHPETVTNLRGVVSPLIEVTGQAEPLIEMTGQHESKDLLSKATHLDLLDRFAGAAKERKEYSEKYSKLKEISKRIEELTQKELTRHQQLDYLIFQRDEIKSLDLKSGDDLRLEEEIRSQKEGERWLRFSQKIHHMFDSGDRSFLSTIEKLIQEGHALAKEKEGNRKLIHPLEQIPPLCEELVYGLKSHCDRMEIDPDRLEQLESKLSQLRKIQKKFGSSVDQILDSLKLMEEEIDELENCESLMVQLRRDQQELTHELRTLGGRLHQLRTRGGEELSNRVNEELRELNMKGVAFTVMVEQAPEPTPTGMSTVEFMIQPPHSSSSLLPLAKFASGGELSRILLSLKQVVGQSHLPRTFLFDEVDAGVSGKTAEKLGRKLRKIAKEGQVICVTHLPQVASFGDLHFLIEKQTSSEHVEVIVKKMTPKERVREIARLISGEKVTQTSLDHAKHLIESGVGVSV